LKRKKDRQALIAAKDRLRGEERRKERKREEKSRRLATYEPRRVPAEGVCASMGGDEHLTLLQPKKFGSLGSNQQ
jgi:hypothetical protein